MRYARIAMIAVLFLAVGTFPYARAEGTDAAGCSKAGKFMQKRHEARSEKAQEMYAKLKITPEQKQKLEANKQQHRDKMKALFEEIRGLQEGLNQELAKPSLDMNKVKSIQEKVKLAQSQMSDARLESMLEIRKILTPEQFSEFISFTGSHRFMRQGKDRR